MRSWGMTFLGTAKLAVTCLLVAALPSIAPAEPDVTQRARLFLETLATNPSRTSELVTADAVAAIGDIGGPFSEFLTELRPKVGWFATCRVASLEAKPSPFGADSRSDDIPPRFRGGKLEVFEGAYSCTWPNGSVRDVPVMVILKDDRVVQFMMMMEQSESP